MELTQGKKSNYIGQVKKDEKLDAHLGLVDRDLQDLWRVVNYLSPMVSTVKSALTTNATIGFSYMPLMDNPPTGTPTSYTGKVAMVFCTSNSGFYIYNTSSNAWKVVTLS